MFEAKLSILNEDQNHQKDFEKAAYSYLESLSTVADLEIETPTAQVKDTRGDLPLWANIVVTGISTGAFMAIYTLAKDMFSIYTNAEVQLHFEDGSSIALKHLTPEEAQSIIQEHLERNQNEKKNS